MVLNLPAEDHGLQERLRFQPGVQSREWGRHWLEDLELAPDWRRGPTQRADLPDQS